ncbi:TIGR04086 family membrane protein [Bacillus sp. PK3_68]|uniref:TIGR04086 family membrane protein n=1 Tax=Bacillus sp. PK3_68 TaxID=2027408 RepID=UPI00217EE2A5|nr:TIGR04086 family membrane protein [Bacillus sp. PK3_68]
MKPFSYGIMYGTIVIFVFAAVCSLVFSLILRFSTLNESSLHLSITITSFFVLFIGGFISGKLSGQKGWLSGGAAGLLYSLVMILYQYLGHDSVFGWEQLVYHLCFIVTAMMGGVLGVNMSSKK